MFGEIIQRHREQKALTQWKKSALGIAISKHINEYFTNFPRLANFSDKSKEEIVLDFYKLVMGFYNAPNPILAMRINLSSYVYEYAGYAVLSLTEKELENNANNNIYSSSFISGQLHLHIRKLSEHIDELKELIWKDPDITDSELIEFCNIRRLLLLFYVNGINLVRCDLGDFDEEKDWFQPFIKSMLIWRESTFREEANLPAQLKEKLDGLKYSSFLNMVENGHKNPFFEWQKEWPELNI
jgi:hypothetical protein